MRRSSIHSVFSLTDPIFHAGKAGAACALALVMAYALAIPDKVTASFVAVLCCAPAALMGLRTSLEQLAGSIVGGVFGTLAAQSGLPEMAGVPLAISFAILCTHAIGFHQGTVVAAFTALFVQIVSFGGPLKTFGFRIEAVAIAACSAFVVNVVVSAFFYETLFDKRLHRSKGRLDDLLVAAAERGPGVLHGFFAVTSQLNAELAQAVRELGWRRNGAMVSRLRAREAQAVWLRDYAHLLVDLEFSITGQEAETRDFLRWLIRREGTQPALQGAGQAAATRILAHLAAEPAWPA